jgi:sugar/nucleoside kinase (ribokinase family)
VAAVDLLTAGEAFEDLIFFGLPHLPRSGEEVRTHGFARTIGGGALITAIAAARLGVRTRVVSAVSDAAVHVLRAERISLENLRRADEPHAVTVSLSTSHNRGFVTFSGVNDRLEARFRNALNRLRRVYVHLAFSPAHCAWWQRAVERLRARGSIISGDFGWNEPLRKDRAFLPMLCALDYVFLNEDEALLYSGQRTLRAAAEFWRSHTRNTVIKLGRRGSRWLDAERDLSVPAPRVRPLDTTGAGDAFNGAFLYARIMGLAPRQSLRIANLVGALSTRAPGGIDALPRLGDLP